MKKDTTGIRVFVYGSLKKDHTNHRCIEGAEYLGRCYIVGDYEMIDMQYYPGVLKGGGNKCNRIYGEVYRVDKDTLDALDILEGHPSYYERIKVDTPWKKAWVYLLPASYSEKGFAVIKNGMWHPTQEEKEWIRTAA